MSVWPFIRRNDCDHRHPNSNSHLSVPLWLTNQNPANSDWIRSHWLNDAEPRWYRLCYKLRNKSLLSGSSELSAASPVAAALPFRKIGFTCSVIALWISPINVSSSLCLSKSNVNRSLVPSSDLIAPCKCTFCFFFFVSKNLNKQNKLLRLLSWSFRPICKRFQRFIAFLKKEQLMNSFRWREINLGINLSCEGSSSADETLLISPPPGSALGEPTPPLTPL